MQEDPQNYGRSRESSDVPDGPGSDPTGAGMSKGGLVSPRDERTWSMLAHLSVLAWPFTGFLPVAPLILWLVYKDRSPMVGFHALQSLWYQAAWLALGVIGGAVGTVFVLVTFGLGIFLVGPLALLLGLAPFVHQLYAAYKVYGGANYRYPFVADRIDGGRGTRSIV